MSNRALRKIHGSNVLDSLKQNLSSESEEDPVLAVAKPSSKKKPAINPFALLNEQEESDSNASPFPEEKADACKDSTSHAGQITDSDVANQASGVKPKKKKNKKKKRSAETKGDQTSAPNNELDEVEKSVREVNALLGELPNRNEQGSSTRATATNRDLLTIERKHLCAENELKKIFGSKVVQAELRKKGRGRLPMKSTWLVTPSPHWAQLGKVTGGLTMNLLESDGKTAVFAYEHSKDYQKIQMQFLQAVESLNPENIAAVVNAYPHHIDSLLQLSDICRMGEDMQTATELIERALYCLELAFHPSFNIAQGNCRLEYRRQENRALFLAIFKHLMYVGQKGCYRTALEFCKLLYNLDPDADPLAVLLMIDFYALRAQEHDWLIRFYLQFESVKNFSQLPNMAYSIAAAYFGKHRSESDSSDLEKANHYLQEALIVFPGVLQPLLDKCSIQADPRVATHEFFGIKARSTQTPALEQLIQLYVGRSYHVWKEPDLLPWLERNAHAVLERVDAKDPHVGDYEDKRKKRYQGMPRNIYRHILMSEIKDATATLPPNLAEGPLMTFDPLPPADSINSYSVTRTASTTQGNDGSLLSVFLRSLMPGYNVVEPRGAAGVAAAQGHLPAAAVAAAEGGQEGQDEQRNAGIDLRRSVTSLVDSLRDLLGHVHLAEVQASDEADSDDSED